MILRMAWRNTWRNPRRTAIVAISVAVGIAGCVVTMALNMGLVQGMVDTAIATGLGHVQVHAPGWDQDPLLRIRFTDGGRKVTTVLDGMDGVSAWAPRLRGEGLVSSPRASVGMRVLGVDPVGEPGVSVLSSSVVEGKWLDASERRVLIGRAAAKRLQVEVGSKIVVSVQDLAGELTGQAFRVGGLFHVASRELDEGVVVLPIAAAQDLFAVVESVSEVVVLTADRRDVPEVVAALAEILGDEAEVRSWMQLAPMLVYMIDSFDMQAWVVYAAVFVAMAFGIANVLLMSVYERTRELGMMSAMGMSRGRVIRLVLVESLFVTILGLTVGFGIAALGVWSLSGGIDMTRFADSMEALAVGNRVVPVIRGYDFWVPLGVGAATALLSGLWPALRASRGRPADSLRHV